MSQIQYTSLDRVFMKLYRDLPINEIAEESVIEWIGEALEAIETPSLKEEAIYFTEVKDHQCEIPIGNLGIIGVAYNHCNHVGDDSFCPKAVVDEIAPVEPLGPAIPVILDCKGQPTQDYEVAYYRPFFDLQSEYFGWINSAHYKKYTPIRLATGSLLNELGCADENLRQYGEYEYRVIQGKYLRFNFKEGIVAIAYRRAMTDPETGYPMIPDDYSTVTAITKYVTMMIMQREYYAGRDGSQGKFETAQRDWQWYCKQASNKHFMINGIDEHQNFLEQRQYILPNNRKYYSFFGNLGKGENRIFNDPDGRNRRYRFLLGK